MRRLGIIAGIIALFFSVACGEMQGDGELVVVDGKGDTRWGWNDDGDSCSFNSTCGEGLFCQPNGVAVGQILGKLESWLIDKTCGTRRGEDGLCDDDDDCEVGLACAERLAFAEIPGHGTVSYKLSTCSAPTDQTG